MIEALVWLVFGVGVVAVPALLLIFRRFDSRWSLFALVFYLLNAGFAAWYLAPWSYWSFWLYLALLIVAGAAVIVGLVRLRSADWRRPGWKALVGSVVAALAGAYLLSLNLQSVSARTAPPDALALQSPVRGGQFAVVQGGSGRPLQGPHFANPSQKFAVDMVRLNGGLTSFRNYLQNGDFTEAEIWEEPVYSPCAGEVVWARDGIEDRREPDEKAPAGNVVGIECEGATVMLAHLLQNSVAVEEGDRVEAGQPLGRIGLSGRTFGPHLHMHAERGPLKRDFSDNEPVPFTLEGKFPYKGRIIEIAN